jgi:hypothetical protein
MELTVGLADEVGATPFVQHAAIPADCYDVGCVTIDMLPDEVLLGVFYSCLCGEGT